MPLTCDHFYCMQVCEYFENVFLYENGFKNPLINIKQYTFNVVHLLHRWGVGVGRYVEGVKSSDL